MERFTRGNVSNHLRRPLATLQPILARPGKPTVDIARLEQEVAGIARVLPMIEIKSPEHWIETVRGLGPDVDAIIPVSVPAYPTEVWNSHPEVLVERGLPVVFWPLMEYDEPDFWRWSARDMLRALGVTVHLVPSIRDGKDPAQGARYAALSSRLPSGGVWRAEFIPGTRVRPGISSRKAWERP